MIKIRKFYGSDIYEYLYSLKVFMYMCLAIYLLRITLNLLQNLITENPIKASDFFIILNSDDCN